MLQKVEQNSLCTWQWTPNSYHHPSSDACIHSQETSFGSGWGHTIYPLRRVGGAERIERIECVKYVELLAMKFIICTTVRKYSETTWMSLEIFAVFGNNLIFLNWSGGSNHWIFFEFIFHDLQIICLVLLAGILATCDFNLWFLILDEFSRGYLLNGIMSRS